ncbi:MAG: 23S rRNA (pseudouridine(1915)-N(3))-methyltransferase RlmH [Flavobacteriales bacterium]
MKIELIIVGKTDSSWIQDGFNVYKKRLSHYISFNTVLIPNLKNRKNLSIQQQKDLEGKLILKYIQPTNFVVLLDEKGKSLSSIDFSNFLQQKMNIGTKKLVFVIGGAYGFSKEIYDVSNQLFSLSKMTFSHQMIRPFFVEQLYRAFTILNNEPYHHV